jgi:hypothetical protein
MIYASISTGKIITDAARLARFERNPERDTDIKEIKVPGDHKHGDLFQLGTRARFKFIAPSWVKRAAQYATA